MKRKQIEAVPLKLPADAAGKYITAQEEGGLLILDYFLNETFQFRHAMDITTGEYGTWYPEGKWTGEKLYTAAGEGYWGEMRETEYLMEKEDKALVLRATNGFDWIANGYERIDRMESQYSRDMRDEKEYRKRKRIQELMDLCSSVGEGIRQWIEEKAAGELYYAFYRKTVKRYQCTACGEMFAEQAAGAKIKHKQTFSCPLCQKTVTAWKRGDRISIETGLTILEKLDEKRSVERIFRAQIAWENRREAYLEEHIRVVMLHGGKKPCQIYYKDGFGEWTENNPHNRRDRKSYLYPGTNIRAALEGTEYEVWGNVLPQMAQADVDVNYNRLLIERDESFTRMTEYLFKGRFFRLLQETADNISPWHGYDGTLNRCGDTIEEVMELDDRQRINRLRNENGGEGMLEWLRFEENEGVRISAETMRWLEAAGISASDYEKSKAKAYLSPEKLMHYIERQKKESYLKKHVRQVFEQYEDYLSMAERLGKKLEDEMVHRPRELKRRHDELVEEFRLMQEELKRKDDAEAARRQAEAMRQKYPGYEDILLEVKEKFEYANETYLIRVPEDFMEITAEGMALHHCAGSSERYFNRIVDRETYICFLRQQASPEEPFYTIEVEPGGTIRQHRGAYDEEPGIEEIKPFLREWQKEIRKRMSKEDHEHAERSAVLRQKNIEELKEKNNTRVLNGLMEDLMEVI